MGTAVVAAGQTRFGAHPTATPGRLFADAFQRMLSDADRPLDPSRIDAAYVGSLSCGQGLQLGNFAPAMLGEISLAGIPALHVESACASGSFALHEAITAVESGRHRCVLAAGVERMRDVSAERGRYWLGISGDTQYERLSGLTFAGIFALMAARLVTEGRITREDLANVAVKNHRHARINPDAQLRREVTVEQVLSAPAVASPFGLYDCCPTSDGAACVLVVDRAMAEEFTDLPVRVIGRGAAGAPVALHSRSTVTELSAVGRAARAAYRQAGIGPDDLDLAEVHDCFTVAELLSYPELGLAESLEGGTARLQAGEFNLGGTLPINTSGGLKAKGHPIAATGIGQVVEIFHQLRGEAVDADRQISRPEIGLASNMGGSGASATVTILQRS